MKLFRMTILFGIMLVVFSLSIQAADNRRIPVAKKVTSFSKIEQAFSIGKIDQGERILHNLQAALEPEKLPDEFKMAEVLPVKSATPYILDAVRNWELLSPAEKAQVSAYLYRPTMDSIYISPDGHFAIRYSLRFPDSTSADDLDESGFPDYVERAAIYADSAYRYYQGHQGYLPPPPDADGIYDIYLVSLGFAYGSTSYEQQGDSSWNDYSSYIKINCNMQSIIYDNQDPEGDVIGALKVTCVHEFFHATQFAYDAFEELWWMESTATAFEDVLYGEVKDNYQFLPYFFDYPDSSMNSGPYSCYGAFVWPLYLINRYDTSVIKNIFEYARFYGALESIDSVLAAYDTDLTVAYPEFTVWNYFTGDRDDGSHYPDGAGFPYMPWDQSLANYPFTQVNPVTAPDGLGCNYLISYPDPMPAGLLKLGFDGAPSATWRFSYILFDGNEITEVVDCPMDQYEKAFTAVYDFTRYDSMVFIPSVVSLAEEAHHYDFYTEMLPFGDLNGDGNVNLSDILYMINYIYLEGPQPIGGSISSDVDCDGYNNLADILYLITNVYNEGPDPCIYYPE
jgi:dockerin type I repeat protein